MENGGGMQVVRGLKSKKEANILKKMKQVQPVAFQGTLFLRKVRRVIKKTISFHKLRLIQSSLHLLSKHQWSSSKFAKGKTISWYWQTRVWYLTKKVFKQGLSKPKIQRMFGTSRDRSLPRLSANEAMESPNYDKRFCNAGSISTCKTYSI